jgi:hypothetical protein
MDRKWVIHMTSWVVADKKFVKVQMEWKPLVTVAAVQLYKLAPVSGPYLCHFKPAVVLERINRFWGSVGRSRKGLRNALHIYIRPYMDKNGGNNLSMLIVVVIIIIIVLVTGLFFLLLLLNQRWPPPLTLQVSHCSTFCIMCDVLSIAVFCSEYIKCFPGIASRFLIFFTISMAPIITGITIHFKCHIRYIYT